MNHVQRLTARTQLEIERKRARWGWFDILVRTFKRFGEDEGGPLAAALTYYMFFSIFPLLLFGAAALGYVTSGNATLQEELVASGLKTVPILRDALSPDGMQLIQDNRNSLALTGTVLALYAGSGVVVALQHALNRIAHVDDEPNFVQKRLRSLAWLAILGLGAVLSLGLTTVTGFAPGIVGSLLALTAGLAVNTGLFAAAFKFLPARAAAAWKEVLPGAIVAAVGFEVLAIAGTSYLARGEAARNNTFGTFAAAATLLLASYLVSQIVLLSAEVNAVLAERRATRQSLSTN